MGNALLRQGLYALKSERANADEAEEIVIDHPLAAAAAAVASGWIPGAGSTISTVIGIGFVQSLILEWYMLQRLFTSI